MIHDAHVLFQNAVRVLQAEPPSVVPTSSDVSDPETSRKIQRLQESRDFKKDVLGVGVDGTAAAAEEEKDTRPAVARALFERAIALHPRHADAYSRLATLLSSSAFGEHWRSVICR